MNNDRLDAHIIAKQEADQQAEDNKDNEDSEEEDPSNPDEDKPP